MKHLIQIIAAAGFIVLGQTEVFAQNSSVISGQDSSRRVITTAVPFLMIAPDARSGAMGDVGVATTPDANSAHWNPAKLAFIKSDLGFSLSYTPWLNKIINDMSISYLSGYKKIGNDQAVGISLRYFDLGDIQLTDEGPNSTVINLGTFSPREFAIDATYSRILSEQLSLGLSGRFIHSNLSGNIGSQNNDGKAGISVAADVGVYYHSDLTVGGMKSDIAFGAAITNIGSKITYNSSSNRDFIPTNLRIGTAYTTSLDPYNTLTFALDFNKLMVPSTPIYAFNADGSPTIDPETNEQAIERGKDPDRPLLSGMFGSFSDAPDGFSEEMKEINISFGAEYWYNDVFAARAGYFYETKMKGNRRYFTLGLGFRYQKFGIDFAYLIPQEQNNPLAETLRFSLLFNLSKNENSPGTTSTQNN